MINEVLMFVYFHILKVKLAKPDITNVKNISNLHKLGLKLDVHLLCFNKLNFSQIRRF